MNKKITSETTKKKAVIVSLFSTKKPNTQCINNDNNNENHKIPNSHNNDKNEIKKETNNQKKI